MPNTANMIVSRDVVTRGAKLKGEKAITAHSIFKNGFLYMRKICESLIRRKIEKFSYVRRCFVVFFFFSFSYNALQNGRIFENAGCPIL